MLVPLLRRIVETSARAFAGFALLWCVPANSQTADVIYYNGNIITSGINIPQFRRSPFKVTSSLPSAPMQRS